MSCNHFMHGSLSVSSSPCVDDLIHSLFIIFDLGRCACEIFGIDYYVVLSLS